MNAVGFARFLGWFSIGLGAFELLRGNALGRAIGMPDRTGLLRAYGAREVLNGLAILCEPSAPGPVWARLGGDLLDLGTLATALPYGRGQRRDLRVAVAAVTMATLLDLACGVLLSRPSPGHRRDAW